MFALSVIQLTTDALFSCSVLMLTAYGCCQPSLARGGLGPGRAGGDVAEWTAGAANNMISAIASHVSQEAG